MHGIFEGWRSHDRRRRRASRRIRARKFPPSPVSSARLARFDARSDRDRARSACRRGANKARRPSAAGFRPDTICLARNAESRRARSACCSRRIRSSARWRFVGPTASVFHSADWKSSIEMKVGSPPMVSRTSCAFEIAIDVFAEPIERCPGLVRKRPRHARRLVDARRPSSRRRKRLRPDRPSAEIGAAER